VPVSAPLLSAFVSRTTILVLVLALALAGAGCGESLEGKFGDELFRAGCARCHADDGSGGIGPAIGRPDSDAALVLTDEQIRGSIRVGPGRMPSFDRLTEEQLDSLVDHVRALQQGTVGGDD
jgi:mono/diheme cytochrome c family protein